MNAPSPTRALYLRQVLITALILFVFAVFGTAMVAFTFDATAPTIEANARAELLANLHRLIPPELHNNDLATDLIRVTDPALLGTAAPVTIYRARLNGQPTGLVLTPVAPDGYSGPIHLLVAIKVDGTLAGVRVARHRETPGLGDLIQADRSDWILSFDGRSLQDPPDRLWAVRRDGGVFDQFTGATITPRAVVKAVKKSLIYFERHQEQLFAPAEPAAAGAPSAGAP
jgi:Na+-translocating ferredoxin:NAD+ oxidoreductase subunit G